MAQTMITADIEGSSAISRVEYLKEDRILTIAFVNGTAYEFHEAPIDMLFGLLSADSAGRFFNLFIKPLYNK